MAKKSSNTIGNPYHDESTGEFTSPDKDKESNQNQSFSTLSLKKGVDLSNFPKKPTIQLKKDVDISNLSKSNTKNDNIHLKQGMSLSDFVSKLDDLNQCANVPRLSSARDIENHIEEYFSKQVCTKINELYGHSDNCQSYQYRPKSNPNKILEIFPNVLAKYRYKDNHAHYISFDEYQRLKTQPGYIQIYRGFSSVGMKAQNIKNSYVNPDLNSFDLLCPAGGNCYGSNVYTSTNFRTAQSYAGYSGGGTVIYGILDENNAYSMSSRQVSSISRSIDKTNIATKIENKMIENGIDQTRANKIANSFVKAMNNDIGVCAILLGLDYFEATDGQFQKNLLNLSRWYIRN